jgi:hypothetical protein
MLARRIGRGRPVDAGFGSALFERKRRKGGDQSEGGAWGGMNSKVKDE